MNQALTIGLICVIFARQTAIYLIIWHYKVQVRTEKYNRGKGLFTQITIDGYFSSTSTETALVHKEEIKVCKVSPKRYYMGKRRYWEGETWVSFLNIREK